MVRGKLQAESIHKSHGIIAGCVLELWPSRNEIRRCRRGFQVSEAMFETFRHFFAQAPLCLFFILAYFAERPGRKRQYQSDLPADQNCAGACDA